VGIPLIFNKPIPAFDRSCGMRLWTATGKIFFDMRLGLLGPVLGYHEPLTEGLVLDQFGILGEAPSGMISLAELRLKQFLSARSHLSSIYLCTGEAEANTIATNLAVNSFGPQSPTIAVITSAIPATRVPTSQDAVSYWHWNQGIRVYWVSLENVKEQLHANGWEGISAICIDPVQVSSGIKVDLKTLQMLRHWCSEHDVGLIFDEKFCGLGRSGNLFAYERLGVRPDIVTFAATIVPGWSVNGVLWSTAVQDTPLAEMQAETMTSKVPAPIYAGVLSTFRLISELIAKGRVGDLCSLMDKILADSLLGAAEGRIAGFRSFGILAAIDFKEPIAEKICSCCLDSGLLLGYISERTILFGPSLTAEPAEVADALGILFEVIKAV